MIVAASSFTTKTSRLMSALACFVFLLQAATAATPSVTSVTTGDSDGDGYIDQITINFDIAVDVTDGDANDGFSNVSLDHYTVVNADYAATNVTSLTLGLTEGSVPDTAATPRIRISGGNIKGHGSSDNINVYEVTAVTDGAGPALLRAVGQTTSSNVVLTFSEPVYTTAGSGNLILADFTYTNHSGGGATSISSISDADGSDKQVTLVLDANPSARDGALDLLACASSAMFDAAGNAAVGSNGIVMGNLWSPVYLDNKTLWFDAADVAAKRIVSGTTIDRWFDKSGNDNNAYQNTSGDRPNWDVTTRAVQLVGAGASNDTGHYFNLRFDTTAQTLITVTNNVGTGQTMGMLSDLDDRGGAKFLYWHYHSGALGYPASVDGNNSYNTGKIALDGGTFSTVAANPGTGAFPSTGTITVLEAAAQDTGMDAIFTLSNSGAPHFRPTMDCHEYLVINDTLSVSEREIVEGYLAHRWNLTANLPGGHTYKSTPPGLTNSITAVSTADLDMDGYIDAIHVTCSAAVQDSTIIASDFTVSGGVTVLDAPSVMADDTANDNDFYITFTDGILTTAATPTVSYTRSYHGLQDYGPATATDGAPPAILSAVGTSTGTTVTLTFSEAAYTTAGSGALVLGDFSYTNHSGSGVSSITAIIDGDASDSVMSLTLGANPTLHDAALDLIGCASSEIYDAAGNAASAAVGYRLSDLWSPAAMGEKSLWFDASEVQSLGVRTGTTVEDWADRSGLNNHANQTVDADRPSFDVSTRAVQLRGNGFTEFTGHYFNLTSSATARTLFLVVDNMADDKLAAILSDTDDRGSGTYLYWHHTTRDQGYSTSFNGNLPSDPTGRVAFNGEAFSTAAGDTGTADHPMTATISLMESTAQQTGFDTMFGLTGKILPVQYRSDMDCHELLVFTDVLTTAERRRVEGYLAHRWNLTGNLSVSHPYKSSPPGYTTITSVATADLDADGFIDAIRVIAPENVDDSTVNAGDFSISGASGLAFSSTSGGDSAGDNDFYITFTDGVLAGDVTPTVTYTPGSLATTINIIQAYGPVTATDAAPPVITSISAQLDSTNLTVQFSEPVYTTNAGSGDLITADFTYTDANSAEASAVTINEANGSDEQITLTTNNAIGGGDVDNDSLACAASAIYDAAGNVAATTATSIQVSNRWLPSSLGTLQVWLDADDSSNVSTSGSAVTSWLDKSGNNHHASQGSSGNRPSTGANVNGRSVISFDGANDYLDIAADSSFDHDQWTMIAVGAPNVSGSNMVWVRSNYTAGAAANTGILWGGWIRGSDQAIATHARDAAGSIKISYAGTADGSSKIFGFRWLADNTLTAYGNGTPDTTQTDVSASPSSHVRTRIGAAPGTPSAYFSGEFAEVVMVRAGVDLPTYQRIEGYLAHKWGLAGNLASDHPYRSKAPRSDAVAPTAVLISSATIAENQSSGSTVGTLSTTDADGSDSFTYSLVSGSGDTDNASFSISGATLQSAAVFDRETKNSYAIRLRSTDSYGYYIEAAMTITISNINETITITEGSTVGVTMDEDNTPTAFSLTLNATDIDGDVPNWSIASQGSKGTASASGTGASKTIAYSVNANANGADSFVVQVSDGNGMTDSITVNVTINPQGDAPVITEGSSIGVNLDEDSSPTAFALTLNATDIDGDTLTWSISSAASQGTASTSGTGASKAISYTPNANYNGNDSFVVQVSDGTGRQDTITVTATIAARNDAPVNSAIPTLSGTTQIGQQLSATTGSWSDTTDLSPGTISYTYQWLRADDASGTNSSSISGETAATYTITMADSSKYLACRITATDDGEGLPSNAAGTAQSSWQMIPNLQPVINAVTTHDSDKDGRIDGIVLSFSRSVDIVDGNSSDGLSGLSIVGYTMVAADYSATNQNQLTIAVQEASSPDSGNRPLVSYTAGAQLIDHASAVQVNALAATQASDGVEPVITAITGTANSTNLTITTSEAVYTTAGGSGDLVLGDLIYNDGNAGGAASISALPDGDAADSSFSITVSPGLTQADFTADTVQAASNAIFDAAGNAMRTDTASFTNIDGSPPLILTRHTGDADANGFIDRIILTFSEPILDGTAALSAFTVQGYVINAIDTGGSSNDAEIILILQEGLSPDTSATPLVHYQAGGLSDHASNRLASDSGSGVAATDRAAPVLLYAQGSSGTNSLLITFSEDIGAGGLTASDLSYTDGNAADSSGIATLIDTQIGDRSLIITTTGALSSSDFGNDSVEAGTNRIADGNGNYAATTAVTISNLGSAPERPRIITDPPMGAVAGTSYTYDIEVDITKMPITQQPGVFNPVQLVFRLLSAPSGATISATSTRFARLSWPATGSAGSYVRFLVEVHDPDSGTADTQEVLVLIKDQPVSQQ